MSGVLRPRGPEQPQTYWQRRVAVIVVALAVIAVAIALIAGLVGGDDQQAAAAAEPTRVAGSAPATSTAQAVRTPAQ